MQLDEALAQPPEGATHFRLHKMQAGRGRPTLIRDEERRGKPDSDMWPVEDGPSLEVPDGTYKLEWYRVDDSEVPYKRSPGGVPLGLLSEVITTAAGMEGTPPPGAAAAPAAPMPPPASATEWALVQMSMVQARTVQSVVGGMEKTVAANERLMARLESIYQRSDEKDGSEEGAGVGQFVGGLAEALGPEGVRAMFAGLFRPTGG